MTQSHLNASTAKTSSHLRTLKRIRRLSRLMDTAFGIPGTQFKVGLDPIIGLIPGAGDWITTAISAYILILATRFRLPKGMLGRMIFNILLEAIAGSVPLAGDIFDAFYKANIRNLALLEAHLQAEEPYLQSLPSAEAESVQS
ncbi:MAG: DUF4112 domain-containing protein [Leptolyngbya sp. SIO1D8]|nr:DUF4112 domain-containing protein [Leptolyngbya sp. SIO1D8]